MKYLSKPLVTVGLLAFIAVACGGEETSSSGNDNNTTGTGGSSAMAGSTATGGTLFTTGGSLSVGGSLSTGGAPSYTGGSGGSADGGSDATVPDSGTPGEACGNNVREGDEDCDTGPSGGSGCSASCTFQSSCGVILPLSDPDGDGKWNATSYTTFEEPSGIDAADCEGNSVGAGADRIYALNLDVPARLKITLFTDQFDGILRLRTDPCADVGGLPPEISGLSHCSDVTSPAPDSGGGGEILEYAYVPPGTYYIVVDAVGDDSGYPPGGAFSLTVDVGCTASEALRLVEFNNDEPDYVVVQNTKTCDLDLSGVIVRFDDIGENPIDVPIQGAGTLGPGEYLSVGDTGASLDVEVADAIRMSGSTNGAVALCQDDCDTGVFDGLRYKLSGGVDPNQLPGGATFASPVTGVAFGDEPTKSLVRVAFEGTAPVMVASDWCYAPIGVRTPVVIQELHPGTDAFVRLINRAECAIELSGYEVHFGDRRNDSELPNEDDEPGGLGVDVTMQLPSQTLAGGGSVWVVSANASGDDVLVPDPGIALDPSRPGAAYLCLGECDVIIDAVSFRAEIQDHDFDLYPDGISFVGGGLSGVDSSTEAGATNSYIRNANYAGSNPNFQRSDWGTGGSSR